MLRPKGPFCQSCGMPLSKDKKGGGSNADGSTSAVYCSHCYENGSFTEPDLTVDEMVAKVTEMLREMHLPSFLVKRLVKDLPQLERWRPA